MWEDYRKPDLGLYDNVHKMGFGLWNHRMAAFVFGNGIAVCRRVTLLKSARKGWIPGLVCLLVAVQVIGTFLFPPPRSERAAAMTAPFFYAVLALIAWWADKPNALEPRINRNPRPAGTD